MTDRLLSKQMDMFRVNQEEDQIRNDNHYSDNSIKCKGLSIDNLATINWLLKEIVAKEVQRDKMGVKCITHVCAGHSEMMLAA